MTAFGHLPPTTSGNVADEKAYDCGGAGVDRGGRTNVTGIFWSSSEGTQEGGVGLSKPKPLCIPSFPW